MAVLTILVLTVLLLLEAPNMMERGLAMLPPGRRHRVARVTADCSRTISGYVAGNLLISAIAGLVAFVSLTVLGVPFAAPLAVWVALADLIPLVGATLGRRPLGAGGVPALGTGRDHRPRGVHPLPAVREPCPAGDDHVAHRAAQPAARAGLVLVGVELFGIVGALLAIPVAGVLQVVVKDVYAHRRPTLPAEEAEALAEEVGELTGETPSLLADDDGPAAEDEVGGSRNRVAKSGD